MNLELKDWIPFVNKRKGECSRRCGSLKRILQIAIAASILPPTGLDFEKSHAFPPAPHHTFQGMVRDEWGNPVEATGAEVLFEVSNGVKLRSKIIAGLRPGMNYRLKIPMDSGLTDDNYQPNAMRPQVPFTMRVRIGKTLYVPIEMKGNWAQLGRPGGFTDLNLTLGEDSDGDGLPDAWERALLAQSGGKDIATINPNDDKDGDGLSNLQEYVAGTYAFDPTDGFSLKIKKLTSGQMGLEFLVLQGRSYNVVLSQDLKNWNPIVVRLEDGTSVDSIDAKDVRVVRVVPHGLIASETPNFFRLIVR